MRYQVDALRSKGNTALSQLVVANIDQTKRKKERKKLGADHHQKDRHSTPSNGQMLHLSIRVGSHAAGRFPRAITRVYQYETNPYFVCYSLNHRGPPGKVLYRPTSDCLFSFAAGRTLGVVHVLHHNQYSLDLYISLELKSLIAVVLDGFGA